MKTTRTFDKDGNITSKIEDKSAIEEMLDISERNKTSIKLAKIWAITILLCFICMVILVLITKKC